MIRCIFKREQIMNYVDNSLNIKKFYIKRDVIEYMIR